MKPYKTLLIATLSLSLSAMGYAKDDYLVVLKSFSTPTLQQGKTIDKEVNQLQKQGFHPYFIKTDACPPLEKGSWAMVLGEFDKATADSKLAQVQKLVSDADVRQVNLPELTPIDEEFAYAQTTFGDADCFTFDEEGGNEDWHKSVHCVGKQGYSTKIDYLANLNELFINNKLLDIHIDFSESPAKYPVLWIYHNNNPQKLLAVSFTLADEEGKAIRYLFLVKGKSFVQAKKEFAVDDFNGIADYLHKNIKVAKK